MEPTKTFELFTRSGALHKGGHHLDEKGKPVFTAQESCHRCGGAGGSDKWKFTGWTCFECGGSGKGPIRTHKLYTREQLEKLDATLAKAHAKKAAKAAEAARVREAEIQACRSAFLFSNQELMDRAKEMIHEGDFAYEILQSVLTYAKMSDNQKSALEKAIAEAERKAGTSYIGAIDERREFRGEITLVFQISEGGYAGGFYRAAKYINIIRTTEGTVKYTGSSNLGSKGDSIAFKATIFSHSEYKGEKQTCVERPKLIDDTKSVAAAPVANGEMTAGQKAWATRRARAAERMTA